MKDIKLGDLLIKYREGKCTTEEIKLLENWVSTNTYPEYHISEAQIVEELTSIEKKLPLPERQHRLSLLHIAATVIVLCSTAVVFYFNQQNSLKIQQGPQEIVSGGNKAVLTLNDGKKIALTDVANGPLLQQAGLTIFKTLDGQIVYKIAGTGKASSLKFNTIETPAGGQFKVVLADGTEIWLNASSSLEFPMVFSGNERRVKLSGEAYFQVASNKKRPFKVEVMNNTIEVLGTHFNVMAYKNDRVMTTTLLEGSVHIMNQFGGVTIKPNEQFVFNQNTNRTEVFQVNALDAIAWKNGFFLFEEENIESIMRKVARWYNVDVEYRGKTSDVFLWGSISRFSHIEEVLRRLELTGAVHFKIEGRRVIVMP